MRELFTMLTDWPFRQEEQPKLVDILRESESYVDGLSLVALNGWKNCWTHLIYQNNH